MIPDDGLSQLIQEDHSDRFEGWNPRCGGKHASDMEARLLIKTVNIPSTERGSQYLGLQAGASHD